MKKMQSSQNYIKTVLLCLGCVVVGGALGYYIKPEKVITSHAIRENTDQYKFIKPLLAVDRPDGNVLPSTKSLYASVNKHIDDAIAEKKIDKASLYFIDYSGRLGSFGINENELYSPASLLKTVIMVAYLKESEKNPSLLAQQFVYSPDVKNNIEKIPFDDPSTLTVGGTYTVDELIKKMIIDSDNGAKNLLLSNLDTKYLLQVYSELNLKIPDLENSYQISAKEYSLFIRILYNATYLSSANSEKALSILSKATFKDGLVAGVPAGTVVAHKFGEYADTTNYNINFVELHDCGIVYAPKNPYLLCVMTRGKDIQNLQNEIGAISHIFYTEINK